MDRFVVDYLQLLDGRLDSIRRCLADCDIEGARVAVLSLESSSKMLGGTSLAARLTELRSQLDLGTTPQRNALLSLVEAAATSFRPTCRHRTGRDRSRSRPALGGASPGPVSVSGAPRAGSPRRARSRCSAAN